MSTLTEDTPVSTTGRWAVEVIETPSLGDRSYVLHDGTHAAVVDPQRDLDRVDAVLQEHDLDVVAVLETHVHNDYISGGLELARRTGAAYHLAAEEDLDFDHVPTTDGDRITVGSLVVRAVHTPGHTPHHLSYVLEAGGQDVAVCTGGGLLYGSVGRPDLISPDLTEELSRAQFRSAHRLADQLPLDVAVLPTHGFGSFCSSGDMSEDASESTIAREREVNDALTAPDEDTFVEGLMAGLDAFPAYYAHMGPRNAAGPDAADLTEIVEVDLTELRRRIHAGEWVVDLRDRRAYAAGFLVGTLNVEFDDTAATYLGWILPSLAAEDGESVTLIAAEPEHIEAFQRQLARIGVDRPAGRAGADTALRGPTASYEVVDFEGAAAWLEDDPEAVLLDTRRDLEWDDGHVEDAVHVPLHELLERMGELPDSTLLVHCASGFRSSIAASLLARSGHAVVLVDDEVDRAPDVLPWVA